MPDEETREVPKQVAETSIKQPASPDSNREPVPGWKHPLRAMRAALLSIPLLTGLPVGIHAQTDTNPPDPSVSSATSTPGRDRWFEEAPYGSRGPSITDGTLQISPTIVVPQATPALADTSPGLDAMRQQADHLRQTNPDVYLSNNVPYSGKDFSVLVGASKQAPATHLSFVVVLNNQNQDLARTSLNGWLHSIKMTDQQIQNLDVVFLNPQQEASVSKLKDLFPYFGHNLVIDYNEGQDKTTITLRGKDPTLAEQELNSLLSKNHIGDRYWINNLTINHSAK